MKHRIELWGLFGVAIAVAWGILSLAVSISFHPALWALARFTCPIVPVSLVFHFGVKWYWVIASNFAAYALVGSMVEGLRLLLGRPAASATR